MKESTCDGVTFKHRSYVLLAVSLDARYAALGSVEVGSLVRLMVIKPLKKLFDLCTT